MRSTDATEFEETNHYISVAIVRFSLERQDHAM